jgi:glucokinase
MEMREGTTPPTVLAGDIGGTKTLLALAAPGAHGPRWLRRERYPSAAYSDLESMLDTFLTGTERPAAACLAIAGPVERTAAGGQRARITNLPWVLDSEGLGARLGAPVRLVNDFAGVAHGIAHLPEQSLATLQAGAPEAHGVGAVLGAGTGLGMAVLVPQPGGAVRVLPSEGGHADFAPYGPLQEGFAHWLRAARGLEHVSVERVVSGMGIEALYAYLAATRPALGPPLAAADAPAISAAAQAGDARARLALDEFARAYGAAAGNLALTVLPYGGLYLAGGIAPAR